MLRRWLRGCLLPSAFCLSAVGCTTSVESLTGGLVTSGVSSPKENADLAPARGSNDLTATDQLRLHLDAARNMDKAGNDEGALAEYERVLALDSVNLTAMRRLCVLYDRRGSKDDFKRAEELYRKVAKARPKDADVWSDWGYSLYLRTEKEGCKENWAESEKKLRQALKLDPQHARAHGNLGLVLGQTERYDEAFREFRAAQLNDSEAHCDMAFVYWTKGQLEQARQECRLAREKDPSNSKARDMLAALDQSSHPHTKPAGSSRADGRKPRASTLSDADWQAEREAARRVVAGGAVAAPIAPAATDGRGAPSPGPIVMPSGARWMPVNSGAAPAGKLPAPVTGATEGTITLDN
jgi:Flp pilus assembly protein TadD